MRRPVLALVASSALLLPACSSRTEDGASSEAPIPEFATDDHTTNDGVVTGGDVSQRPPAAELGTLSIDGVNVPLTDPTCLSTGVPLEGLTGFQAALAEEDGSVDVDIDPDAGTATATIERNDQITEYPDMVAEVVNGEVWQLESTPPGTGEEVDLPQVQIVFNCPEVGEIDEPPTGPTDEDGLQGSVDQGEE